MPGDLDIDHLAPLKNAHNSGGWTWDTERKRDYANSLADPDHPIAVTSRANRSKGAKGPDEWKPPDETYWCRYDTDWTEIKAHWNLTMTEAEAEAVQDMLGTQAMPTPINHKSWASPLSWARRVCTEKPPTRSLYRTRWKDVSPGSRGETPQMRSTARLASD